MDLAGFHSKETPVVLVKVSAESPRMDLWDKGFTQDHMTARHRPPIQISILVNATVDIIASVGEI